MGPNEPVLPESIIECPECAARGDRVELVCFTLASHCPKCLHKFRCTRHDDFCDVCGTRWYAVKHRGLHWCITCILSTRE